MLHSTLPRAFLTSGLDYFGSSYYNNADNRPPYPTSFYPPPFEEHYPRVVHEHRQRLFPTWEHPTLDSPPSPLDLSLKATKNDRVQFKVETTEYEEAEKRRSYLENDHGHNLGEDEDENEEKHFVAGNVFDVSRGHVDGRRGWHGSTILRDEEEEEEPRRVPSGHARVEDEELTFETLEGSNTQLRNYPFRSDESPAWNPKHRSLTDPKSAGTTTGIHFQSLQSYRQQLLLQTPHQQHQQQHHFHGIHAPMTPPSTPSPPQCPRKRPREDPSSLVSSPSSPTTEQTDQTTEKSPRLKRKHARRLKFVDDTTSPVSGTVILAAEEAASVIALSAQVNSPVEAARQTTQVISTEKSPRLKKKHARRLKFDEDTSSPVSGTVILGPDSAIVAGDIDPAFNVVEVTDEARADLAKIENRLGPYQCRLCLQLHEDAFQLAQHRCSRIAHLEYRCPECDKRFSCPANLASHRRWHKPRHVLPPPLPPSSDGNDTATRPEPRLALEGTRSKCDNKLGKQATPKKRVPEATNDPDEPTSDDSITAPATNHGHVHDATATSGSGHPISYNVDRVLPGVTLGGHLGVAPLAIEMP